MLLTGNSIKTLGTYISSKKLTFKWDFSKNDYENGEACGKKEMAFGERKKTLAGTVTGNKQLRRRAYIRDLTE